MLSTVVQAIAFPPGLLLVGLVLAGFAANRKQRRLSFVMILAPVCATLLFSLPRVADFIATRIETQAMQESQSTRAAHALPRTAVVLGGFIGLAGRDRPNEAEYDLYSAADRVVAAVRLWRLGQVDRLVLAGGSSNAISEAELMARFAGDLGVPRSVIVLESNSRTTRENAIGVARVLREHRLPPDVALVTSGLHLPRAMIEFRCAGLFPLGVPAEFESLGTVHNFPAAWLPSALALDRSRRALKEWVGGFMVGC